MTKTEEVAVSDGVGLTTGEVVTKDSPAEQWLRSAKLKEILGSDPSHKSLTLLLSKEDGELGVLLLNKSPFSETKEDIEKILGGATLDELAKNDIYGNYKVDIPKEVNYLNASFVYPANDRVIAKYRQEDKVIIKETAEDFNTITAEFIREGALNLQWVYNFLERKAEAERVIYEDPDPHNGFMMAPDLKWNGEDVENLYLLAMVHRRGIRSIRDLTANDIPLLENVRDKGLTAIREKYGVHPNKIRVYFHYQPSFFHLHMHFVVLSYDAPATNILHAVLLDDVINNLQIASDFYKRATLSFARKKSDKLTEMFRKAGRLSE